MPAAARPLTLLALTLALALPAFAGPGPATAPTAVTPGTEIRAVLAEQQAAWNRGDLESFMAAYWRSDSLTFYSGGDVSRGWRMALDRYRRRYQGEGKEMGVLAFDLHDVELLGPDAALVKGGWALAMKDGSPHGLFTLVMRRVPGAGWRIVHDHSSAAAAR